MFSILTRHLSFKPKSIRCTCLDRSQRQYATQGERKLVLGCGSNVVDHFFKVKAVPKPGEKGFFQSPTELLEKSIVGGVTLNHLSWASLLGVPTGLLALQGADVPGGLIRNAMKRLGVSCNFLQVSDEYTTAQAYVFVQRDGERSIIMASGATSLINKKVVDEYFDDAVTNKASILTTEVSQVPLSGVLTLLKAARKANVLSILDLDVSPSVAVGEGNLGTIDELERAVKEADVIKPARHAANEMLSVLRSDLNSKLDSLSATDVARFLHDACNCKMVAMTNGREPSIIVTESMTVEIETEKLKEVTDATGAGDAFLGGLIAGIHFHGMPQTEEEVRALGNLANKTGSACCQVLGGLPDEKSKFSLAAEIEKYASANLEADGAKPASFTPLPDFESSLIADYEATHDVLNSMDYAAASRFIDLVEQCKGTVFVSGIGKSAIVAQRMASSLTSTGTRSTFVHATEWAHGELGLLRQEDVVVFFSHSGNTEECNYAAELVKRHKVPLLGIVGTTDSCLAQMCDEVIDYVIGKDLLEPLGGAPTTSIVLQEMMVNAIVCELIRRRKFTKTDFLWNHPGGSLGRKLSKKLGHNVRFV